MTKEVEGQLSFVDQDSLFGKMSQEHLAQTGGGDFRTVLEEIAKIADPNTVIPRPPKNKWTNAGCIMADGWSIAWRVFDAQFWGTPQRRRRIALVADFGGQCAPEILFESKSMSGHFTESSKTREGTTGDFKSSFGTTKCWPINTMIATRWNRLGERTGLGIGEEGSPQYTLSTAHEHAVCICNFHGSDDNKATNSTNHNHTICIAGNIIGRSDNTGGNGSGFQEDISYTLTATDHHAVCCFDARGNGNGDISSTITGDHENRITDYTTVVCMAHGASHAEVCENLSPTLTCLHEQPIINTDVSVRRLTPLECERLQGFPDGYTDIGEWADNRGRIHKCSDTARYKALGNSIALPSWVWVLSRLCKYLSNKPTMGSLFDGIGGFPLIWENINGKGSCLWASEIESFCIAVTKKHFGE